MALVGSGSTQRSGRRVTREHKVGVVKMFAQTNPLHNKPKTTARQLYFHTNPLIHPDSKTNHRVRLCTNKPS